MDRFDPSPTVGQGDAPRAGEPGAEYQAVAGGNDRVEDVVDEEDWLADPASVGEWVPAGQTAEWQQPITDLSFEGPGADKAHVANRRVGDDATNIWEAGCQQKGQGPTGGLAEETDRAAVADAPAHAAVRIDRVGQALRIASIIGRPYADVPVSPPADRRPRGLQCPRSGEHPATRVEIQKRRSLFVMQRPGKDRPGQRPAGNAMNVICREQPAAGRVCDCGCPRATIPTR